MIDVYKQSLRKPQSRKVEDRHLASRSVAEPFAPARASAERALLTEPPELDESTLHARLDFSALVFIVTQV